MEMIAAVVVAYALVYGGGEAAHEAKRRWGGVSSKYRKKGNGAQKAGVIVVDGLGWLLGSFGRGVANQFKDDSKILTHDRREARRRRRQERQERRQQRRDERAAGRDDQSQDEVPTPQDQPVNAQQPPSTPQAAPMPANGRPAPPPSITKPPVPAPVQANGIRPTNGAHMSAPTGEAGTYEQTLAAYDSLIAHANEMARQAGETVSATEHLGSQQATAGLDDTTRAATSEIAQRAIETQQYWIAVAASAAAAKSTFEAQQSQVREALVAQQQTADAAFYRG